MVSRSVVLAIAVPLCFAMEPASAKTPCPLPESAIKQHLTGSGAIEVVVAAQGSFTARVLDVSSEVFRPTIECFAEHADLLFHVKALELGKWDIPIEFCPFKDVATCPSSTRVWQRDGQPIK